LNFSGFDVETLLRFARMKSYIYSIYKAATIGRGFVAGMGGCSVLDPIQCKAGRPPATITT
jgi:hypothetical protein